MKLIIYRIISSFSIKVSINKIIYALYIYQNYINSIEQTIFDFIKKKIKAHYKIFIHYL